MNTQKWPSIEQLHSLTDEIRARLATAEQLLKHLGKVKENGHYDDSKGPHLLDVIQANQDFDQDIHNYADQLRLWLRDESALSVIQRGEINYASTHLNRLAVVNANITRLSEDFIEYSDFAETYVSALIRSLQCGARR